MSEGTSSGEGLEVEEGNIVSERKQCENGLVGIDGGNEKSSEGGCRLLAVKVRAADTIRYRKSMINASSYLSSNSLILSRANPRTWSTYSRRSG